jgi:hypothetical protein
MNFGELSRKKEKVDFRFFRLKLISTWAILPEDARRAACGEVLGQCYVTCK